MKQTKRKRILFVIPDYHCSFILRDEFRKLGCKSDVYLPFWYPDTMLYKTDVIKYGKRPKSKFLLRLKNFCFLIKFYLNYDFFIIYGSHSIQPLHDDWISKILGTGFQLDMLLGKILRKKFFYFPSGCKDIDLKENIIKLDNGNVCGNCWWTENDCNDVKNKVRFAALNRYFDVIFSEAHLLSTQYQQNFTFYKSIDLAQWRPDLEIPERCHVNKNGALMIMHTFRKPNNGSPNNWKGSPFIEAAVERLKNEGHHIFYFTASDVHPADIKYYQLQADIIVEQLIIGWWGSTGIETTALGKPVVCYLRPEWQKNFFSKNPQYKELPFINADVGTIYDKLKILVENESLREERGKASRVFAEAHYDAVKNAKNIIALMETLA